MKQRNIIKTTNLRDGGALFHYAHFLCDCIFPEVINGFNNFDIIYREKHLKQSLGNFDKLYEEIMKTKTKEIEKNDFNNLKVKHIISPKKEHILKLKYVNYFTNYIFSIYNINPNIYIAEYPEVLLVKRGPNKMLLDKSLILSNINAKDKIDKGILLTTGNVRREIKDINLLESYLIDKYNDKFKALYFENLKFEEQIKYFNNAKIIICAHGAVMSNMFFCKKNTTIVEVTCNTKWIFFDNLSKIQKLNHVKINDNNFNSIKTIINKL
jgi:hypothetical protein